MGYYLDYVNQYKADGLDFCELGSNVIYATITKEQLETNCVFIPKMCYYPYKIIDGKKCYIKEPKIFEFNLTSL